MNKAEEVLGFDFVARGDTPESKQPSEQALDLPAAFVSPERSSVLYARSAASTNGRDQLDFLLRELFLELGAVVGAVADEPFRLGFGEPSFEGALDESDFVTVTCSDGGRYRKTTAICDCHDLGGKPTTSFSHDKAPFFAPAWVPSMKVSLKSSLPRVSRSSASRCSTVCSTPFSTQLWYRRKHVAYGGYRAGMSAQGAPVRRIQRIPFRTSRGSLQGRPRPSSRTLGLGRSGSMTAHCGSVRSISTLDHNVDLLSIPYRFSIYLRDLTIAHL